jgi:hypothetical protein
MAPADEVVGRLPRGAKAICHSVLGVGDERRRLPAMELQEPRSPPGIGLLYDCRKACVVLAGVAGEEGVERLGSHVVLALGSGGGRFVGGARWSDPGGCATAHVRRGALHHTRPRAPGGEEGGEGGRAGASEGARGCARPQPCNVELRLADELRVAAAHRLQDNSVEGGRGRGVRGLVWDGATKSKRVLRERPLRMVEHRFPQTVSQSLSP